jgi:hypothetical protein
MLALARARRRRRRERIRSNLTQMRSIEETTG